MEAAQTNDPLKVLEVLVGVVVAVMVVLATLTVAGTVLGSGTVPGLNAEVCATGSGDQPAFRRVDGESTGPLGLADGITWRAAEGQVCDPDPDGAARGRVRGPGAGPAAHPRQDPHRLGRARLRALRLGQRGPAEPDDRQGAD